VSRLPELDPIELTEDRGRPDPLGSGAEAGARGC